MKEERLKQERLLAILQAGIRDALDEYDACEIYDKLVDLCGCTDEEIAELGFPELIPDSEEALRNAVYKVYNELVENGLDETDTDEVNRVADELTRIMKARTDIIGTPFYEKVKSAYAEFCRAFVQVGHVLDVDAIIGFLGEALDI